VKLSELPTHLPAGQVKQMLKTCYRSTPLGRRNYAIMLLLARLGLRAGEVIRLQLGDIDWEQGCLMVRGKAGRAAQLPLPADVARHGAIHTAGPSALLMPRALHPRLRAAQWINRGQLYSQNRAAGAESRGNKVGARRRPSSAAQPGDGHARSWGFA
jgi:integrase